MEAVLKSPAQCTIVSNEPVHYGTCYEITCTVMSSLPIHYWTRAEITCTRMYNQPVYVGACVEITCTVISNQPIRSLFGITCTVLTNRPLHAGALCWNHLHNNVQAANPLWSLCQHPMRNYQCLINQPIMQYVLNITHLAAMANQPVSWYFMEPVMLISPVNIAGNQTRNHPYNDFSLECVYKTPIGCASKQLITWYHSTSTIGTQ